MARPPSDKHWQLFEHLYLRCPPPLHPTQFLETWEVSYFELAKLSGVSHSTIELWMSSRSASHREPALMQQRRLAVTDRLFRHVDQVSPELIRLWCDSDHPSCKGSEK